MGPILGLNLDPNLNSSLDSNSTYIRHGPVPFVALGRVDVGSQFQIWQNFILKPPVFFSFGKTVALKKDNACLMHLLKKREEKKVASLNFVHPKER